MKKSILILTFIFAFISVSCTVGGANTEDDAYDENSTVVDKANKINEEKEVPVDQDVQIVDENPILLKVRNITTQVKSVYVFNAIILK